MPEFTQFILSFLSFQFILLGGCVLTVLVSLYEKYVRRQEVSTRAYTLVILILAFFSCFQAWQQEHQSRIGREQDLHRQEGQTAQKSEQLVQEFRRRDRCEGSVRDLENSDSRKDGALSAQSSQIQVQQASINGCLSQAMKLLSPDLKLTMHTIDYRPAENGAQIVTILMLTNKPLSPVRISGDCNQSLEKSASARIAGSLTMMGTEVSIAGSRLEFGIDSPSWTPASPILLRLSYKGSGPLNCQFAL